MTQPQASILVVDDEQIKRSVLEDELRAAGYTVAVAANPLEAEPALAEKDFDVVVTDLRMPGQDGLSFLRGLKGRRPDQAVIVMTAYGTVDTAVEAMKLGAFDYLQKPFSTEELLLKLDKCLRFERLAEENAALRRQLSAPRADTRIVGQSAAIREILAQVHAVAGTDATVLVHGESGTGKELVARVIHESSHRAGGPFVAVSCAALPIDLVETELFGHEAGAFTGASQRRIGRFESAHAGTLFLDDVDDIPLRVQVKLLRVLQEHTIQRVGADELIHINVRVIGATKKHLPDLVAAGEFRQDLFYRLNVVPLHLPPLRERREDIRPLVQYFLGRLAIKTNRGDMTICEEAIARLESHDWPGNVRELEHVLERMVVLAGSSHIEEDGVPDLSAQWNASRVVSVSLQGVSEVNMSAVLADVEGQLLHWAVREAKGNLAEAARRLSLPRSTLQHRLKRLPEPIEGCEPCD
jgi:DNA-binding NtrC family response regulator